MTVHPTLDTYDLSRLTVQRSVAYCYERSGHHGTVDRSRAAYVLRAARGRGSKIHRTPRGWHIADCGLDLEIN